MIRLFNKTRRAEQGDSAELPEPTVRTTRLIHVGPHKTGTTTVQTAFHFNREVLAEHGIHYFGPNLQPTQAVKAMTGVGASADVRERDQRAWRDMARKARLSGLPNIVISSEFLCEADDAVARQIIEDLAGPADTRVVITLRPLAKMFPSQWQQFVQSGTVMSLEDWTEAVLDHAPEPGTVDLFWRRHRHDELVRRWAGIVGPENVTVIVCDTRDHDQLTREFARLLDIPAELLVPMSKDENRSLTWEEAEAIRAFNIEFDELNEQRRAKGRREVSINIDERLAAWRHVKRRKPTPEEHRVQIPAAAADRITALANEIVDNIVTSGVEIIGDIEQLREVPSAEKLAGAVTPTAVPIAVASRVANGPLIQIGRRKPPAQ